MTLVIIHNHFRPSGVRRVIEIAAPELARHLSAKTIVLASGERPDRTWLKRFALSVAPVLVENRTNDALAYFGEQSESAKMRQCLRSFLHSLLSDRRDAVVWAHNQGLGRNLLLTAELQRTCAALELPLVLHHHDWWFDNRWQRWPELRRAGFRTLARVAETIFNGGPNVRHIAINASDAAILATHLGSRTGWLPNPLVHGSPASAATTRRSREWLEKVIGEKGPVWLMPCRLLRRKNIAEALLLTRWLRPEAWLVTTGGPSSSEEEPYAAALAEAAGRNQWRLCLGVLRGPEARQPGVDELLAASEVALLTSLQEGFGLPYLEAAAARRPLIARALPNIMPDLEHFGFQFPYTYSEILVPRCLFSWREELRRQERLYFSWRSQLPSVCRRIAGTPWLIKGVAGYVPFSRLTLVAQLEILSVPPEESWSASVPLNPFLPAWREAAEARKLLVPRWPAAAASRLGAPSYASKWSRLLERKSSRPLPRQAAAHAQFEFIRDRLATGNLYPLSLG